MTEITRMQQKRGSTAQWIESDPVLADGEIGLEKDTNKIKMGDGSKKWSELPYFGGPAETIPPTTTMWFDSERGPETAWAWTDPAGLDTYRTVVPVLHYSHIGAHPMTFSVGGTDGNSPAYLIAPYTADVDSVSDPGLYHVEGLLIGTSGGDTSHVFGHPLQVFWNIGLFPAGVEEPPLEYNNYGVEDSITLNGYIWTSRVSGDMILDGDREWASVASPWMSYGTWATMGSDGDIADRALITILKCIVTARRVSNWTPKPA